MERKHRHDIIKTQKTCDYCDRTHSASSWQMGRWVRRCLGCFTAYYRSRFVEVAPGIFKAGTLDNSIWWLGER